MELVADGVNLTATGESELDSIPDEAMLRKLVIYESISAKEKQ